MYWEGEKMDKDTKIINGQNVEDTVLESTTSKVLANNTNQIISEGDANAKSITKLIKHGGDVVGYELSDGQRVSMQQAIEMAKANQLAHVGVSTSKSGEAYIRSLPDADESNNLGNLPSISE